MPMSQAPAEISSFFTGLVSDTSPLNAPASASKEEQNFELERKGERARRLGMDLEDEFVYVDTGSTDPTMVFSHYVWDNAGGDPTSKFLVVQAGADVKIHSLSSTPYSPKLLHTFSDFGPSTQKFSFTSVDGLLIGATGEKEVKIIEYDIDTETFSLSTTTLLIRDLFGVEDVVSSVDLLAANNISKRPSTSSNAHYYNLRNQTWAVPRLNGNNETTQDPIISFLSASSSLYPSNADYVTYSLFSDSGDTDDRVSERFFAKDLVSNPPAQERAPVGYYIIDALERGTSRLAAVQATETSYSYSSHLVTDLPDDTTPGGPSVISSYSGRVFYSGFSGKVTDGDKNSPRMSSYVLFSRLVRNPSDVGLCYQIGDPTSKESPDLVDTDGGFIRLDEAYGIQGMVNISKALVVITSNGVWSISGGSDYGFKATDYQVQRLTDRGCVAQNSIVLLENSVAFWGDDGIYQVSTNQYGDLQATNITLEKISDFYDSILPEKKKNCYGVFDSLAKKVRWVYNSYIDRDGEVMELVFNIPFGAWTLNKYYDSTSKTLTVSTPIKTGNITVASDVNFVVSDGQLVTSDGEDVFILDTAIRGGAKETVYLIINHDYGQTVKYSFGSHKSRKFADWESVDGVGVDALAFLMPHPITGNDAQRAKQFKWLLTHFQRTENGVEFTDGDYRVTNPSGCTFQSRWNFTESNGTGKWSREFQAYRLKRAFFTDGESDIYEYGYPVISTRHKVIGRGISFTFRFTSQPEKDCIILGCSMIMTSNGDD